MTCDIIIAVWNEPEATKNCLEGVIKYTDFTYRLIIIDNGSDPETAQYLDSLKDKVADLMLIRNKENIGYVQAINQGFKLSNADYVCLLNNDTIVTEGWLAEMIKIFEENLSVGIVNPSSNTLAQALPEGETPDSYAEKIKIFTGQWGELGQCSGFCMLIKREVIEKIGIFDEAYEVGYFEESDYCRKTQKLGFRFARAKAAYVYHIDRLTFDKRLDKEALFEKNRALFESRWGRSLRVLCVISRRPKDQIDKDETEQIILSSAQDNHQVYIYIIKNLIARFNFAKHSNIIIRPSRGIFFGFASLFKILTKKHKKKFDLILVDDLFFFSVLKFLSFLHKAKILFNPHLEHAIELSKKQAFSK